MALAPPFVDIALRKTQADQGYAGFVPTGYFSGSAQVVNGQPRLLFPAVFRAPNVTAEVPVSAVCELGRLLRSVSLCLSVSFRVHVFLCLCVSVSLFLCESVA